jgi:hypothetical protein
MVQSRRVIPGQDAQLTRTARTRGRRAAFGAAILVALTLGLAGLPALHSNSARVTPIAPVTQDSRELWVRIASELVDKVPAHILLGSPGSHSELDAKLREARLDRSLFQRTAAAIRAETTCERDDAEQQTMATTFEDLPLPDHFELVGQTSSPPPQTHPPQAARELVCELEARLLSNNASTHP